MLGPESVGIIASAVPVSGLYKSWRKRVAGRVAEGKLSLNRMPRTLKVFRSEATGLAVRVIKLSSLDLVVYND